MVYKPVGVDENSLFPPRVQAVIATEISTAVNSAVGSEASRAAAAETALANLISSLAAVANTGNYSDLVGTAPILTRLYNAATSTWPARPVCTLCWNIGGDEAHPPTGSVANDIWDRSA